MLFEKVGALYFALVLCQAGAQSLLEFLDGTRWDVDDGKGFKLQFHLNNELCDGAQGSYTLRSGLLSNLTENGNA